MFLDIYIYFIMLIMSMLVFIYSYNQILLNLIGMEFMMLNLLMLFNNLMILNNSMNLLLYYLVFMVCESVLGLTILITLIRSNGNDNCNLLNLTMW